MIMPHNGILVANGGFSAHWSGLLYDAPSAERVFVANRGNASIGYGLSGGIGAQLCRRKESRGGLSWDTEASTLPWVILKRQSASRFP